MGASSPVGTRLMTYPGSDFLIARRLLLAGASAFFALPALANLGPELVTGTLAKFQLAKQPKPLPELAFNGADDKPLKLADYKGKAVLLNFWATWCVPCVKEMPSLDRLQAEMGKDKFVVLPLSLKQIEADYGEGAREIGAKLAEARAEAEKHEPKGAKLKAILADCGDMVKSFAPLVPAWKAVQRVARLVGLD